jgi:hypothetical protein
MHKNESDKLSLESYIVKLTNLSKYELTILDKEKRKEVKQLILDLITKLSNINKL